MSISSSKGVNLRPFQDSDTLRRRKKDIKRSWLGHVERGFIFSYRDFQVLDARQITFLSVDFKHTRGLIQTTLRFEKPQEYETFKSASIPSISAIMAPHITTFSVPADVGGSFVGKSRAPAAILSTGFNEKLEACGYSTSTLDALPEGSPQWRPTTMGPNGVRDEGLVVDVCRSVKKSLMSSLASDNASFHLILGGDCYIAPAVLSAYSHSYPDLRVGLLYVDGNSDLFVPREPDHSGTLPAMTMTHMTMRPGALESMRQFSKVDGSPVVSNDNVVLFGIVAGHPSNKQEHLGYLLDHQFRVITSETVAKDPAKKAEEALRWLEDRVDLILVHLDVDVIDCADFPLGTVPIWGAAPFNAIVKAIPIFLASEKVKGLTLAELVPDRDVGLQMTGRLLDELIAGFAQRIRQRPLISTK